MPRRVSRKPKASHTPARTREPLAEGIRKRRPPGFFSKISDDELVAYAKKVMKKKGISGRYELQKADLGLYYVLRKRKLLDKVGFEKKHRDWAPMGGEEIVDYAKKFMKEKGISGRGELEKADRGLYNALWKRKLLDEIGFESKKRNERDWAPMGGEEIVDYAKKFMKEEEISGRKELAKADGGLYNVLRERKLLDEIGFESKRRKKRDWASMSDGEVVAFAKEFMESNWISGKKELKEAYLGLYNALRGRKLLDKVRFEKKMRKKRYWASMSDDELVAYAKKIMKENKIDGRGELTKADGGLYKALRIRKLLDKVGFEEKYRDWASMSNDKLVAFAKRFIEENEISRRKELDNVDHGLYDALRRRKLLDLVFLDIEKAKQRHADDEVIRVLEEFGGS